MVGDGRSRWLAGTYAGLMLSGSALDGRSPVSGRNSTFPSAVLRARSQTETPVSRRAESDRGIEQCFRRRKKRLTTSRGGLRGLACLCGRVALGRQSSHQFVPRVIKRLGALALQVAGQRHHVDSGLGESIEHVFCIAAVSRHRPGDVTMIGKAAQRVVGDRVDRVRRGEGFDVEHIRRRSGLSCWCSPRGGAAAVPRLSRASASAARRADHDRRRTCDSRRQSRVCSQAREAT